MSVHVNVLQVHVILLQMLCHGLLSIGAGFEYWVTKAKNLKSHVHSWYILSRRLSQNIIFGTNIKILCQKDSKNTKNLPKEPQNKLLWQIYKGYAQRIPK